MDKQNFLVCLKKFSESAVKDLILPVSKQSDSKESERAAEVHLMRLADSDSYKKKAPYIIQQIISGADSQTPGSPAMSTATVRSIFAVYNKDEQEGSLALLGLMERLRIALLKKAIIGERYELDTTTSKMEYLIYPNDVAPYYGGEMISTWKLPAIQREVRNVWR